MAKTVCRICLRPDSADHGDPDDLLVQFHLELCEYDVCVLPALKFCVPCKEQLDSLFTFRQKCQQANQILMSWSQSHDKICLEDIHKQLLPISKPEKQITIVLSEEVIIKVEKPEQENPLVSETNDLKNDFHIDVINDCDIDDLKTENDYLDDSDYDYDRKKRKKITKKRSKIKHETKEISDGKSNKSHTKIKERILKLIELGKFNDLGENITMSKELFLKMFDRCDKSKLRSLVPLKQGSTEELKKLKKFLLRILKKNNPEFDTIFDIEHLDTEAKKIAEFNQRKFSKEYLEAAFKCELCYKVFEVQSLLDYHNRWHQVASGAHACSLCGMRFSSRKALAQHLKTNHTSVYRCKLCPLTTYNPAVMVNHYNQHKGMEYSCPVCLSVFSNKNTLNNHRRQAHKTSHICPLCARSFVSEKGLYFHKRLKHKDSDCTKAENCVTCVQCNATLDSPEVLLTHIRQVHDSGAQTIFKCFHCKEIFSSLEELKRHKVDLDHQRPPKPTPRPSADKSTASEEDKTCEECDKTFNSRKSYLRHANMHHRTNRIHKCGFCQAKFTSSDALSLHRESAGHQRKVRYVRKPRAPRLDTRLRCNDPDKPFDKCQLCEEMISTTRTTAMYQHFQTTHPDVPYSSVYSQPHNKHLCDQCGKTFKDLTFFIDHKNLHTGAKPYACKACPRSFATRRHLRLHAERHAPPRHQCRDCGKLFNSAGNLFAHRRGHIGDRRFKCEICFKGFLHAAALSEHVRGVHHHIRRARKCKTTGEL